MMKKLQEMDRYLSALLKTVLHIDWDVLEAIYMELKWFPQKPTIDWIESHQDDNPNLILPIPVELIVHADELATIGVNNLPPKSHVPFDSLVKIQLNFVGGTITQNYPYFLQEELLLYLLHEQYEKSFGWKGAEFDDIDWELF